VKVVQQATEHMTMRSPRHVVPPNDTPGPTTKAMPVTASSAPAQWNPLIRSRPRSAETTARIAGVVPTMSAALEAVDNETPPTKKNW
jgi:hypothetical protein